MGEQIEGGERNAGVSRFQLYVKRTGVSATAPLLGKSPNPLIPFPGGEGEIILIEGLVVSPAGEPPAVSPPANCCPSNSRQNHFRGSAPHTPAGWASPSGLAIARQGMSSSRRYCQRLDRRANSQTLAKEAKGSPERRAFPLMDSRASTTPRFRRMGSTPGVGAGGSTDLGV